MNQKISSILEKASGEKSRGNYSKALDQIASAIEEHPRELELYKEVIGLGLEAGEPLQTIKYFKKAMSRFAAAKDDLYEFAAGLEMKSCDPIFGKYLLEHSIRDKNLQEGFRIVRILNKHVLEDLLLRTRKKSDTLSSALRGGHNLNAELTINELSKAILTLALGNIREGALIFIQQIDSGSCEFERIEPLLKDLEKMHPQNSLIRYALGSGYLSRDEIDKGIQHIVMAVKLNPELVDDITRRLEDASGKDSPSHDSLEVALLEAYSLQNNTSKLADLAQSMLDSSPQKSDQVLDLIGKYLDRGGSDWGLEEFYLDASLRSNQTKRIRGYLQQTWKLKDKRRNNLDWLEARSKSGSLPPDLQVHFGKLVLDEGRTDWAINIFKRTVPDSPSEVQNIISILGEKNHSEPEIKDFRRELQALAREDQPDAASDGGFDIQSFERTEFSLSNFEKEGGGAGFELENNILDAGSSLTVPGSEFSSLEAAELADPADAPERDPLPAEEPPGEKPVNSGVQSPLGMDLASGPDPSTVDSAKPATEQFREKMDNDGVLDRIDEAINQGRFDEAKALLGFHPVTIREEVTRILRLADYYFCTDRPLCALIALKSFDPGALNRKEKQDLMTRMAASYRALKMFEAAHSVLIHLMNDEPSDTRLVSLAKVNYEDYLKERGEGSLVLEKVCFLES